jgi:DNA-binding transcriptional MerR regulator
MFSFQKRASMDTYDSKTASRIVGVSLRQIQYWDEQGFIRPSVKLAGGRGTKRLYSFQDLICLKVVKDLTHHGLSLQKIRRCLRPLKKYSVRKSQPAESLKYLTDGEDLFVITNSREKILDAVNRQFVVSLGIGNLVRELDGQARRTVHGMFRKGSRPVRAIEEKRSSA